MPEQKKKIHKKCKNCGKFFVSFISEKKKFCCMKCFRAYGKKSIIIKTCKTCGNEFVTYKSKKQKFCSKKCKHIAQGKVLSTGKYKKCLYCNKEFYTTKSKNKQRFCSLDCFHIYKRENKEKRYCVICNKELCHQNKKYCSITCMSINYQTILLKENNPNWKGIEKYRSTGLPTHIRKQVLKRDGYKCKKCGVVDWEQSPSLLHIHHIVPVVDGGTEDLDNLITLCIYCHWTGEHGFKLNKTLQKVISAAGCGG